MDSIHLGQCIQLHRVSYHVVKCMQSHANSNFLRMKIGFNSCIDSVYVGQCIQLHSISYHVRKCIRTYSKAVISGRQCIQLHSISYNVRKCIKTYSKAAISGRQCIQLYSISYHVRKCIQTYSKAGNASSISCNVESAFNHTLTVIFMNENWVQLMHRYYFFLQKASSTYELVRCWKRDSSAHRQ